MRFFVLLGWSIFSIVIALIVGPFRNGLTRRFMRSWAPPALRIMGARVVGDSFGPFPRNRRSVVMVNHQSNADVAVMLSRLPVDVRFVAKSQLKKVPFLGRYMAATGMVFVDRANPAQAYESLERAASQLGPGDCILVFPEGTRSRDGRMLPLKRGGFKLALLADALIVPVAIMGTRDIWTPGDWRLRPGTVRFRVAESIDSTRYGTDDGAIDRLRADVASVMNAMVEELQDSPATLDSIDRRASVPSSPHD